MYKIRKLLFLLSLLILVSYVYGIYKLNIIRCNECENYSINYLRYQYDFKHYPLYCDYNNNKFEFNNIEYLGFTLEIYWSACNNENLDSRLHNQKNLNLWENMWYNYGCCSILIYLIVLKKILFKFIKYLISIIYNFYIIIIF